MKRKAYHIFTVKNEVIKAFFRFVNAQEALYASHEHHMVLTPEIAKDLFAYNFEAYPNLHFHVHDFAIKNWPLTQFKYIRWMQQADKVFLHYMPTYNAPILASFFPVFRERVVWIIWGGDAYKSLKLGRKAIPFEFIERKVYKRLNLISSSQEIEFQRIIQVFNIKKAKFVNLIYPIDSFQAMPDRTEKEDPKVEGPRKILLGNSACPTNRHIEAIDLINRNINKFGSLVKIYCPLSYSITDLQYQQQVIQYGKTVLGDAFIPITDYQKPESYFQFLASIDVFIMNHQRQRGIGVLRTALYWGKVVYMAAENINLKHFKNEGLQLFEIEQLETKPLVSELPILEKNHNARLMMENYNEKRAVELWQKALN